MKTYSETYNWIKSVFSEMMLTKPQVYMLACFTLFQTSGTNGSKLKRSITDYFSLKSKDFDKHIQYLKSKSFLDAGNYNWRTDSYEYTLNQELLVPMMMFLKNEKPETTQDVLDVFQEMRPSPIQKVLWNYIISDGEAKVDFKGIDTALYANMLIGLVGESFFVKLLLRLSFGDYSMIIDQAIVNLLENQGMVDTSVIRVLLKSRRTSSEDHKGQILRLMCATDFYDYLAYGRKPDHLLAINKNHRFIAAIHEAYAGNIDAAYEHFRQALKLASHRYSFEGRRVSSSPARLFNLNIINFFCYLICYMQGTEEALKRCSILQKASDYESTSGAKFLNNTFHNTLTDGELAVMNMYGTETKAVLAHLVAHYAESRVLPLLKSSTPQWLIFKQEFRSFIKISDADTEAVNKAYGEKGLLASIYRKKEWEIVLDELMGKKSDTSRPADKTMRIAYVLGSMDSHHVNVRQQNILKSGAWGAGKQVSMSNFTNGTVEGMTETDKKIASTVNYSYYYYDDLLIHNVLNYYDDSVNIFVGTYAPYTPVSVTEEMPYLSMERTADGFDIVSNVPKTIDENHTVYITHRGATSINFIRITKSQLPYYQRLLNLGHFPLEAEEQLKEFLNGLGQKVLYDGAQIEVNSDLIEGGSTLQMVDGDPTIILQMRPHDKESYAVSLFCRPLEGGKVRCYPHEGNEIVIDYNEGKRVRVKRDMQKEQENIMRFVGDLSDEVTEMMTFLSSNSYLTVPAYDLLPIIEYAQAHTDYISCEWPEGAEMKVKARQTTAAWGGTIKKNENGWFEIEGSVQLDQDKVVSMAQLLDLVSQARGRYIKLGEGEFLALSDKLRKQLNMLNTVASRTHGHLQMSPFSAAVLGMDELSGELMLEEDEELKQIRQKITDSSKYSPRVPKTLNATLRNYQKDGFKWMSRLNSWGAGALLADDMGLGKTIQTITFLLSKSSEGPALVLAPASVAPNWKTEFEKFAPSLSVTMLNFAENRSKTIKEAKAGDVIVTTYGLLLSVKDDITSKHWTTICLDEAHIVKNRGAKTSAVAMQLKSDYRVMLTGTPVQNHLGELWNLFQFVNPGLLGSFESFNKRFIIPIEQNKDKEVQKMLDRLVKPFMLRRTKEKVAKELPEKEEIYQHVDCTEEEMVIYEAMRQKAEALLLAEASNTVSMNTLAEITRLRQCACDTRLLEEGRKGSSDKPGSKITALLELLTNIVEGEGHALVFSQFTSYLSLIQKALKKADIPYLYIDGSVNIKQRTKLVNEFQEGKTPVFLISLKAGGLGLNLTRANYVIHMDPWWNPAIEAQATDRAHRIGQKNAVTVYHLIASGTIEEKIQRLHESKKALVENILDSTDTSHKLTGEELLEMVRG